MVKKRFTLIALLLLAALLTTGAVYQSKPGRAQWEYKVVFIPDKTSEDESRKMLDEFGADGWEMVAVQPRNADTARGLYHFKRQR